MIPATTAIRRSRVANIDTDRLIRRRAQLRHDIANSNLVFDTRMDFAWRALEMRAIEDELVRRDALPDARVTS